VLASMAHSPDVTAGCLSCPTCLRPGTVAEDGKLNQRGHRHVLHFADLCYKDDKQQQRGKIGNLGQQHIELY